jgi:glycosyltransferase involved in cell wall biosynthesis
MAFAPNNFKKIRVAILATHPIQYQAPLWRTLAMDTRLDIHVVYGSDLSVRGYRDKEFGVRVQWDTPLLAGYSYEFLERDPSLDQISFRRPSGKGLGASLDRFRPDVAVLNAYHGLYPLRGLLEARLRGIPVVMRHEASDEALTRTPLKSLVRDVALRALYSQIACFAAIGTNARRHLLRLGVPGARIGRTPYCVDSEALEHQYTQWMPQRPALRQALNVREEDYVLIFSGKLIPKKQPLLLLSAIALLPSKVRNRLHLVIIGDGAQRSEVETRGRELLGARLHLVGFVNQSQVGRWYAVADCLVLPSQRGAGETWGLVVNEGMQFGLRIVVSDGVGCAPDLLNDSTGQIFPANDVEALAQVLACERARTIQYHAASRDRARCYSLFSAANGLKETLVGVAGSSPNFAVSRAW